MQLYVNLWALAAVGSMTVVTQRTAFLDFIRQYPQSLAELGKVSLLSGIGQVFVFATIVVFDPLVLSIVTTTRKVGTIVVSTLYFGHNLGAMQWMGVMILFCGLIYSDLADALYDKWLSPSNDKEKARGLIGIV